LFYFIGRESEPVADVCRAIRSSVRKKKKKRDIISYTHHPHLSQPLRGLFCFEPNTSFSGQSYSQSIILVTPALTITKK